MKIIVSFDVICVHQIFKFINGRRSSAGLTECYKILDVKILVGYLRDVEM